jgi:hypothetical protein
MQAERAQDPLPDLLGVAVPGCPLDEHAEHEVVDAVVLLPGAGGEDQRLLQDRAE